MSVRDNTSEPTPRTEVDSKGSVEPSADGRVSRIPVITYHSIDDSGSVVSTSPAVFRRQMRKLSDAGYRTLTMGQFAASIASGSWPGERSLVLTFDDGFENFLTEAFPVLRDHSFSATVYLVTAQCGRFNDWAGNPPELPRSRLLSWEQVKDLSRQGIEFGSHTMRHPDLTRLDAQAVDFELSQSRAVIEETLGSKVTSFAYPFGRSNDSVRRSVRKLYASACSTDLGKVGGGSDVYRLERIDAYYLSNPRSIDMIDTPWMDAYLAVRQGLRNVKANL